MDKQRYVLINGEKVYVSEEVYRAYYRPVWREAKQRKVRSEMEYSLDALKDNGFEADSSAASLDEIVSDKLLLDKLYAALAEMTDAERNLIDAHFFQEKSERDISAESGTPQTTINYRKKQLLKLLQKKLK